MAAQKGRGGQNQWYHLGIGAPPIVEPISVGIGMLTERDVDPWLNQLLFKSTPTFFKFGPISWPHVSLPACHVEGGSLREFVQGHQGPLPSGVVPNLQDMFKTDG